MVIVADMGRMQTQKLGENEPQRNPAGFWGSFKNENSQITKAKTLTQHDGAPHLKLTRSSTSSYFMFPRR